MNEHSETGHILAASDYPGGYRLLRLQAPGCAAHIRPGQFVQISGQPLPVMRVSAEQGWMECLGRLTKPHTPDTQVEVTGPSGKGFDVDAATPRALLVGSEGGLAPLLFLTDVLRSHRPRVKPLLLLAAEHTLPFRPQPSRIMVPGLPAWVIASLPLVEDWGVPSRLASSQEWPGCFQGPLEDLARGWLDSLQGAADVTVYACGSEELLAASRRLADDYRLPCQTVAEICET